MIKKKVLVLEKKYRLWYLYQNRTLVLVPDTITWFRSYTRSEKGPWIFENCKKPRHSPDILQRRNAREPGFLTKHCYWLVDGHKGFLFQDLKKKFKEPFVTLNICFDGEIWLKNLKRTLWHPGNDYLNVSNFNFDKCWTLFGPIFGT